MMHHRLFRPSDLGLVGIVFAIIGLTVWLANVGS